MAMRVSVLVPLLYLLLDPVFVLVSVGLGHKVIVCTNDQADAAEEKGNTRQKFNFLSISPLLTEALILVVVLKNKRI
jgi:hypothetical protein